MRFFPLLLAGLVGTALVSQGQGLPAGQTESSKPPKKITILPVPVIFYQQETGAGYGLGGLLSGRFGQDTLTRASNARAQAWFTQKHQSLFQFVHTIYSPGEQYYLNGEISYYKNLLYYYGIGNDTKKENESGLSNNLLIINQRVQKSIAPKLFAGLMYRFTRTTDNTPEQYATDGHSPNYFLSSDNGRLDQRQRQNTSISGVGPVITFDDRDVALAAFKGNLLDMSIMFNGKGIGSDYNFVRYQVDARHFQPIFSSKTILALQFLGQFHSGDVPFRELAGLGANLGGTLYNNANLDRGIYEQRFRDRQMMTFQAELRQHLFWRIDGAAFGSVGQVGYNITDFTVDGIKPAGGLGARFNFIRRDRVNLRFDYAWGSAPGFYFAIGEAF
ncbi:BamA/TamA family outer membrane protein [Hymenobacter sp. BRD67]|uniref:BamA/TamA family outer membrane protein n=1 Tax=Hymenobacter sp. BRD67 TaxID=2675877 RepID=UPI0015647057|nr:BamA/TamA family outer membrane protein [Hymenobacter sp. BRD67]QKG53563.1 BamA/TamA family outer membrane protein [Hymenobacter sp. BRD67]